MSLAMTILPSGAGPTVKDPVCGMRVDAWTAVLFEEYRGTRYVFCSQRCAERFSEQPEAYIEIPA